MEECVKCEKRKPRDQFREDKKKKNGLSSWCRECMLKANKKYSRKYRRINLRDTRKASLEYRHENLERVNKRAKQTREELKREVYGHYSNGEYKCACCGIDVYEFLCIDHINNDGNVDRKNNPSHQTGDKLCRRLKRDGYPEGYQLLCYNCNITKGIYNVCAHKL